MQLLRLLGNVGILFFGTAVVLENMNHSTSSECTRCSRNEWDFPVTVTVQSGSIKSTSVVYFKRTTLPICLLGSNVDSHVVTVASSTNTTHTPEQHRSEFSTNMISVVPMFVILIIVILWKIGEALSTVATKWANFYLDESEKTAVMQLSDGDYEDSLSTLENAVVFANQYNILSEVGLAGFKHLMAKAYLGVGNGEMAEVLLTNILLVYEPYGDDDPLTQRVRRDLMFALYCQGKGELTYWETAIVSEEGSLKGENLDDASEEEDGNVNDSSDNERVPATLMESVRSSFNSPYVTHLLAKHRSRGKLTNYLQRKELMDGGKGGPDYFSYEYVLCQSPDTITAHN